MRLFPYSDSVVLRCMSCLFGLSVLFISVAVKAGETSDVRIIFLNDLSSSNYEALAAVHPQFEGTAVQWTQQDVETIADAPEAMQPLVSDLILTRQADAVVWCTLTTPAMLYFSYRTQNGTHLISRSLEGVGDEGRTDAIELIVSNTTSTLMETRKILPPPEKPSVPVVADDRPAQEPETQLHNLSLFAMYVLQLRSSAPQWTHGGRVGLGWPISSVFYSFVAVQIMTSNEFREQQTSVELRHLPFYLGMGLNMNRERWTLSGNVELGLSVVSVSPKTTDEYTQVGDSYRHAAFSMDFFVSLERRLIGQFWGVITAGAEVYLYQRTYAVAGGPEFNRDAFVAQPKVLVGGKWTM